MPSGEELLLGEIECESLLSSLADLRLAAKDIWTSDIRIIKDFTDHGIKHSERLADYASKLLGLTKKTDTCPLFEEEMYLLLAGIYLHDIGMQCDLAKFPEIQDKAEEMGALFNIDFKNKTSSYTEEEQEEIRKNHQYLSAAWIEYAYINEDNPFHQAAKTIPDSLVTDLIDICKYHSKLPIEKCPPNFHSNERYSKQRLAALLRFIDELDVDWHRASDKTLKYFNIKEPNKLYWYLHHRTNIEILDPNVIIMRIRLHPDDFKLYEPLVYEALITKFQIKNQALIKILRNNGIPTAISAASGLIEDKFISHLPPEIIEELKGRQMRRYSLIELVDEVRILLTTIGYDISVSNIFGERIVDLIAKYKPLNQTIQVRCIEGDITKGDVHSMEQDLSHQGWLICSKRVLALARDQASKNDNIDVFNLSELLQEKVWGTYVCYFKSFVERENISKLYLDLPCHRVGINEQEIRDNSLDNFLDNWLKEEGNNCISILGEFGLGKKWFCYHYTHRQLMRYLVDPVNERIPLFISLRTLAKEMTIKQLINNTLLEKYNLSIAGSPYDFFCKLNSRGKLLLILEGFDKVACMTDDQQTVEILIQILQLIENRSKVIFTSRKECIPKCKIDEQDNLKSLYIKVQELHLEPLNNELIRKIIDLQMGELNGKDIANQIFRKSSTTMMIRKPVLLRLFLASLNKNDYNYVDSSAQIYLYSTDKLLLRKMKTGSVFTSNADKLYFLCELSWTMIKSGDLRIHWTKIPENVHDYFKNKNKLLDKKDYWHDEIEVQDMLTYDSDGYYEFSHKSLVEYFVALKIAAELDCLDPSFFKTYFEGMQCGNPFNLMNNLHLKETFGFFPLDDHRMNVISSLLVEMVSKDAGNLLKIIIDNELKRPLKAANYIIRNAEWLYRIIESNHRNDIKQLDE